MTIPPQLSFADENRMNAYNFSFGALSSSNDIKLSDYKGSVVLVVNTASKCGFTSQYEGLQEIYNKYKEKGFVIIGVPSNDFGDQEPGTSEEIANFCKLNYGVSFPMTGKQVVKGDNAHPFYLWARKELGFGTAPKWNFHKYLVNRQGELVDYYSSITKPTSKRLMSAIEKLLNES